jgi:hypothetical protein
VVLHISDKRLASASGSRSGPPAGLTPACGRHGAAWLADGASGSWYVRAGATRTAPEGERNAKVPKPLETTTRIHASGEVAMAFVFPVSPTPTIPLSLLQRKDRVRV